MILPYLAAALLVVVTIYAAFVSFRRPEDATRTWIVPEAASRSSKIAISILTLALLTGLAIWLRMGAHKPPQRTSRFLIPEGYTGWIRIEFEVPGAPTLPTQNGQYVLRIPQDSVLQTSSPEQYGWANDQYFYYSEQGVRSLPDSGLAELIWGKINGEHSGATGNTKYEEFFVGTLEQFKDQGGGPKKAGDRGAVSP
jgi:hypothetical protein